MLAYDVEMSTLSRIEEPLPNSLRQPNAVIHCGDALAVLGRLPTHSVDMCMTSPPYWGHREYDTGGIGEEDCYIKYVKNLSNILSEVKRVLLPGGSLWLNIGDTYKDKCLMGIPWRVALSLMEDGWILRNDVIWNKIKGAPDQSKDKLRNIHEHVFHFVKQKSYYYNVDEIRSKPRKSIIVKGSVVSATGVTGIRYRRQIELSTSLAIEEKAAALKALEQVLSDIRAEKLSDFRMVIRNQQRSTHSDSVKLSGRAKELEAKGFYFLKYHPNGSKPSDVWDIVPEDSQNRLAHFAPFPVDLCRIPISATCPVGGTVLDPFCGTGTTLVTALSLARNGIGIDISPTYAEMTRERVSQMTSRLL